jgi:hypothetical protein
MSDPFEDAEPADPKRWVPPPDFRTFLEMMRYDRYGDFLPFEEEDFPDYMGTIEEYREYGYDGY